MVDWLCKGLVALGHEVTLLAPAGSIPAPGVKWREIRPERGFLEELRRHLPPGCEILHSMVPLACEQEALLQLPVLTTIHGNGKPGETFSKGAVFVSADHARRHGSRAFVHNGIDPSEFAVALPAPRRGLVFLSKTSWRIKNLRGAARIARLAGVPLQIAGGSRPFSIRVEALLRPSWKWWGSVSGERKARVLAGAQAMIFPVLWDEPFGLVVAEALFSGTPVLGTPRGSLKELLDPAFAAKVGRLIPWEDEPAWIETAEAVCSGRLRFDPEECRAYAQSRFHYLRMAESYVEHYRRLAAGDPLSPADREGPSDGPSTSSPPVRH